MAIDPLAYIRDQLNNAVSTISSTVLQPITQTLNGFYNSVIAPLTGIIQNTVNSVEGSLSNVENTVRSDIVAQLNAIQSGFLNVVNSAQKEVNTVITGVENGFSDVTKAISNTVSSVVTGLSTDFQNLVGFLHTAFLDVGAGIQAGFTQVENETRAVFVPIFSEIGDFLAKIPEAVRFGVSELIDTIEHVRKTIYDWSDNFAKSVKITGKQQLLLDAGAKAIDELGNTVMAGIEPLINDLFSALGFNLGETSGGEIKRLIEVASAEVLVGAGLELTPSIAFIISNFFKSVTDVMLSGTYRSLEYAGNINDPNKIIDVTSAISAFFRGQFTLDELREHFRKEGLGTVQGEALLATSYKILSVSDLISARFRGVIADDATLHARALKVGYHAQEVDDLVKIFKPLFGTSEAIEAYRRGVTIGTQKDPFDDLRAAGWSEERIAALPELTRQLPNIFQIQDFKAKQVDDPALVAKYQLDHGIDEDFFKGATALGYDKKTAQRMYRMYWEYPSLFLLKNLFSTGKIGREDFKAILGQLRFTPYWVDKLTDGLEPKLSEGEIKNQYKYKLIKGEDIAPALVKSGLSEELAKQKSELWQASVKEVNPYDATGTQAEAGKIKDDTKALIITAYKDGILTKTDATTHLQTLNYTADAIGLMLSIADYEILNNDNKKAVDLIKRDLKVGDLALTDAINKLQALVLPDVQLKIYIDELNQIAKPKDKLPSVAEFGKFLKDGIITQEQYAAGLSLLGYADVWVQLFIQAAGYVKPPKAANPA